jgi:hypothetical protein
MDDTSIVVELLTVLAIALLVLVFAIRGARGSMRLGPVAILLVGGGINWLLAPVYLFVYRPPGAPIGLDLASVLHAMTYQPQRLAYDWIADGIFWVVLYLFLRRWPLQSWSARMWVAGLVIAEVGSVLYAALSSYFIFRLNTPDWSLIDSFQLESILNWQFTTAPGYLNFAVTVGQLWLISKWQGTPGQAERIADQVNAVGLKGVVMSKLENQSTRLLCASMLFDSAARQKLLTWLKDKNRAVALELGLDLELAAQVARFAEKRGRQGWAIYFAIFCLAALSAFVTLIFGPILGCIAAMIVWFARNRKEKNTFVSMFWTENFNAEKIRDEFPAELEPEDSDALPSADQNFFVFGGFSPFVGAGQDLGGWSVVIALDKPRMDFGEAAAIRPFHLKEVYDAIDVGLDDLKVPDIEKRDAFFARGTDLRGDHDLLPDMYGRPVQNLPPRVTVNYIYRDDEKVRHYRCYRILDWGGELALSYYLRCSCRGNTLFVETKRFILTPLAAPYRKVDSMMPMDVSQTIGAAIVSVVAGPLLMLASPLWAFFKINEKLGELFSGAEDRKRREMIERTPLFNYGSVTSLRQWLSSGEYGHYFQKMDGDLYNKLFEHEVLDSLVEFLDAHGVDTSELKERQTTILNNGVMVQGGDVKAENLAVGAGSRALKTMKGLVTPPAAKGSTS